MKFFFNIKSLFIILILLIITSKTYAEQYIAFIDLDFIIKNSQVGKTAFSQLKKKKKLFINELSKGKKNLNDMEAQIISQKNVLDESQYKNKIIELRKKINEYNVNKENKNKEISSYALKFNNKIISLVNPIISDYSKEKAISIILQKKNIVIGRNDLDITKDILAELDKKIKSINLDKL